MHKFLEKIITDFHIKLPTNDTHYMYRLKCVSDDGNYIVNIRLVPNNTYDEFFDIKHGISNKKHCVTIPEGIEVEFSNWLRLLYV